jgi:hypothetical protein
MNRIVVERVIGPVLGRNSTDREAERAIPDVRCADGGAGCPRCRRFVSSLTSALDGGIANDPKLDYYQRVP